MTIPEVKQQLEWRYATKKFDSTKKLSDEQLQVLKESLRYAPSSFGLQPWKFVLVNNVELRKQISEAAWNQPQITEASHLFVMTSKKDMTVADGKHFLQTTSEVTGASMEQLGGLVGMIEGFITGRDQETHQAWAGRQVYIPVGMLVATAAYLQIDVCPMEGFDSKKVDEILGLTDGDYTSRVLIAVGFRDASDPTVSRKKVRYPESEVFEVKN